MLYTNVLSLSLTHTHTHTHAREHTPMHTQSPKMLSISYVPDTIILFNPYNGVPPWPSHSPWAESLSHSCTTCPLNLFVWSTYTPYCMPLACWGLRCVLWELRAVCCLNLYQTCHTLGHCPLVFLLIPLMRQVHVYAPQSPSTCPTLVSGLFAGLSSFLSCPPCIASRKQQIFQPSLEQGLKVWREQMAS